MSVGTDADVIGFWVNMERAVNRELKSQKPGDEGQESVAKSE